MISVLANPIILEVVLVVAGFAVIAWLFLGRRRSI
jgi:hypothetical protein